MSELLCRLFVKNREDVNDPRVRTSYGTLVSVVGIVLNLCLFVAKIIVGTLFGAVSIVADAVNNCSDAGTQLLSLVSFRVSSKPADREHPFGHARIEYVISMAVSFLILLVGFELLKESLAMLIDPVLPRASAVAAFVLLGSILVKLWLGFFNRRIARRIHSPVMKATAVDSFTDAVSTTAVLLAMLVRIFFPQISFNVDAVVGLLVAAMILFAGIKLFGEAKNLILGEAPASEVLAKIRATVERYPEILGIHDLTVHNYGANRIIAALHAEVDGKRNVFETHDVIDTVEQELRRIGIEATIHMDPVVTDDARVTALKVRVEEAVSEIDGRIRIHDFRFVEGTTHTNLIFDVAVPFELKLSESEIKRAVADRVSGIDPAYFTVITVDRE